ncbi:nuclear transport factor 2 family protein [Alteromonas confluentis]|uniref:Protein with SnoaL 3 domain, NTF 2 superfamily n=1 Tax=Alteromonas confluentis TaxID=1656094 RepID=A0A1E7ZDD7_9ALTE|nr:nuclear transport factor 2 family protein [Alteromonas confluentis]OFC71526.1 protein with SnoaL 3 domain, NTF 2 superfamily [Alteromonas confluentis]
MKHLLLCSLIVFCSSAIASTPSEKAVATVLDKLHQSAASASYEDYFSTFATDGVFIGTDASETWTVSEFKAYAKPYFDQGRGWTYTPTARHVYFSQSGDVAWFDEMLDSQSYGVTRGTGVLEKRDGKWLVTQYHLTIPLPNELVDDVVKQIQATAQH